MGTVLDINKMAQTIIVPAYQHGLSTVPPKKICPPIINALHLIRSCEKIFEKCNVCFKYLL